MFSRRSSSASCASRPVWSAWSGGGWGSRGWEACGLIADGHGLPLLATPEFADGSIGHGELLARLERWPADGPQPPRTDLEVAMLRLAPGAADLLPNDLLPAYVPAQVPLVIEPYVALPKVTEHTRPDLPGRTWQTVDGETGVFARYVGSGQEISPECSWSGFLVTCLYQGPRPPVVPELPAPLADLARGKARTKLADAARRLAALT